MLPQERTLRSRKAAHSLHAKYDSTGFTCKLLLQLVLEANYKDGKVVHSEPPFATLHKWDRDVLRRHMKILEDKGFVRIHKAKNQY